MVQEVEDTLVSFLERGATIETDILSNIKLLLPPDVTKQLDDLIPPPPNAQPAVDEAAVFDEPPVIYTADSVLENQIGEHQAAALDDVAATEGHHALLSIGDCHFCCWAVRCDAGL